MKYKLHGGLKRKQRNKQKEKKLHGMVTKPWPGILTGTAFVMRSFQTSLLAYVQLLNISIVEIYKIE